MDTSTLKWNCDGMIPAVVQDAQTGQVLTQAWMSRESLDITLEEGQVCLFSRSRRQLWRKGETSGNTQKVVSVTADCDGDSLLIQAIPRGPACHTGAMSCFHQPVLEGEVPFSVAQLYGLVLDRKEKMPEGAYTTYLFEQGIDKILKKVGEESAEVIIAAKNPETEPLVYELADLCYHSLVLMAQRGVTPAMVLAELAGRNRPEGQK